MIRVLHLDFYSNAAGKIPMDLDLFRLADDFAKKELAEPLDLARAQQAWVVCIVRDQYKCKQCGEWFADARCPDPEHAEMVGVIAERPVEVLAIAGLQQMVDCFLFRVKPSDHAAKATKALWDRLNDFLNDQGLRSQEVLLHVSSKGERCPNADEWLLKAGAVPAERFAVKIK